MIEYSLFLGQAMYIYSFLIFLTLINCGHTVIIIPVCFFPKPVCGLTSRDNMLSINLEELNPENGTLTEHNMREVELMQLSAKNYMVS